KFQTSDGSALPNPFRVGISASTIDGTVHPRTQHIKAVVTPADEAASVNIAAFGLTVSNVAKNSSTGEITFDVVGTTKSNQRGDRLLIAHHDPNINKQAPVTVVVPGAIAGPPTYPHDTIGGGVVVENRALNITTTPVLIDIDQGHRALDTIYARFLTIKVLDQFGDLLGDIYKDAEVEENDGLGHVFSINSPLTASGTYADAAG